VTAKTSRQLSKEIATYMEARAADRKPTALRVIPHIVARVGKVKLSALAKEARASAEGTALDPSDYASNCPDIIIVREDGKLQIVDGFHRVSGMVAWAEEEGKDLGKISIRAIFVTGTDESVISDAAEPGPRQDAAIKMIETAAYA
jgi:hypothetical protein